VIQHVKPNESGIQIMVSHGDLLSMPDVVPRQLFNNPGAVVPELSLSAAARAHSGED
jgi:hypothetical protein